MIFNREARMPDVKPPFDDLEILGLLLRGGRDLADKALAGRHGDDAEAVRWRYAKRRMGELVTRYKNDTLFERRGKRD